MNPQTTIKSIIFIWKEDATKTNLPRGPPTKTHRPGMEGIDQRGSTETKGNPEGVAEFHSRYWSICLEDHNKPYSP